MNLLNYRPTIDSLLTDFFNNDVIGRTSDFIHSPAGDILENEKSFQIEIALAGFEKKDLKIDVLNNVLTISGERKKENKKFKIQETYYGKIKKTYELPSNVNSENIDAKFENGVLSITIQKDDKQKQKGSVDIK